MCTTAMSNHVFIYAVWFVTQLISENRSIEAMTGITHKLRHRFERNMSFSNTKELKRPKKIKYYLRLNEPVQKRNQ